VLDVDEPAAVPAIAAELGVSEATVKRLLDSALEKYAAAMPDLDPDYFSTAKAGFFARREPVISDLPQPDPRASRVVDPPLADHRCDARRAPFDGDPMTPNRTFLCMLAELKLERNLTAAQEQQLLTAAATGESSRFVAELDRVRAAAAEHDAGSEPDAFEVHKRNPDLAQFMRWTRVEAAQTKDGQTPPERQLTADDIRNHGMRARRVVILPNLRELADATAARGDRMGTGE
jgi:hypothetical protein